MSKKYAIERPNVRGKFATDIPGARLLKANASGEFVLTGATDNNAVAVTPNGTQSAGPKRLAFWLHTAGRVEVELASSAAPGNIANLADDGKVQAGAGTVRVGVFYTGGAAGETAEVIPG